MTREATSATRQDNAGDIIYVIDFDDGAQTTITVESSSGLCITSKTVIPTVDTGDNTSAQTVTDIDDHLTDMGLIA